MKWCVGTEMRPGDKIQAVRSGGMVFRAPGTVVAVGDLIVIEWAWGDFEKIEAETSEFALV